jgi:hypothetical protein
VQRGATKPVPFAEPLSTSVAASPSGLSPLPRQSEARSEVGMRPTGGDSFGGRGGGDDVTPEPHSRYSTQPVTPSEGASSPARGGAGGRYAAEEEHAMPSRPLPLSSPGRGGTRPGGSPSGTSAAAPADAPGRYSGAADSYGYGGAGDRQSSPSGGGRDVADEIGNFDQSLFGVRRADPNLL